MHYSIGFVCAFGILTVFFSLVIIVLLSTLMSAIVRLMERKPAASATPEPEAPQSDPQLMAAITAAIADDLGVAFSNVTITAMKKV